MAGKSNPIGAVDPALAKLGFTRLKKEKRTWFTMDVSGDTKSGKTYLSLTMPGTIGILNTDRSLQDTLEGFLDDHPDVDVVIKDFSSKISPGEELSQDQAKMLEREFSAGYNALLDSPHIRSVSVDKWTTIWEVARYAEFGRASVKSHHYVPVNLRMRSYLTRAKDSKKNVLFIEDTKEEWIGEKPTGRKIVDGFKYTPGLVQVNGFIERDKDRDFVLTVTGCGPNADLVGETFVNDQVDWRKMGPMVMPSTMPKDWE